MTLGASRIGFWYLNDPVDITWSTSTDGVQNPSPCGQPGGWSITNQGRTIRFTVQDDELQCGGCNPDIQSGIATATLVTGSQAYNFTYNLTGYGEGQDTGFELMDLTIAGGAYGSGTLLIQAQSAGGGLGCSSLPVTQNVIVNPPILLATSTTYTFTLNFTTGDAQFHKDSYYECTLSFARV